MKIPTNLKHKPILEVPNYDDIDGPYIGDTDAMGLSIGIAQWNTAGWTDLSAKVWRNSGDKWSRQSEELPLHRVLDLASLVCIAMQYCRDGNNLSSPDGFPVQRSGDNPELKRHLELMKKEIDDNKIHLDKSLERLALEFKKLGY
ncbi:hypothetical protein I2494_18035 [Budviciaceae bacterium BWR-B9]|uniref:Uncharacterized protein n=1 Tax=Limnobaculum allomyrinae TaxID=2791986 RepID=A0ABS1IV02_9GAMM|nr:MULTISPECIES: DUF6530 family protein [Limnobaculum]MBK5145582.1 hypothetical protein [Limnobaculum allomyrinae]MBV7693700.1 hypothetical protein [Limnobaculum sp. M2-1]